MAKGGFRSLVSAVSEQFQEIKEGLSLFPYFDSWDETSITELCRIATIQQYPPDSVILGCGNSHMVYFVLEGICLMIHYLQVMEKKKPFKNPTYSLYQAARSDSNISESKSVKYSSIMFNEKINWEAIEVEQEPEVRESPQLETVDVVPEEKIQDGGDQDTNVTTKEDNDNKEKEEVNDTELETPMETESKQTPLTESQHQEPVSESSEPTDRCSEPQESIPESTELISDPQERPLIHEEFVKESERKKSEEKPENSLSEQQEPTIESEEVEYKKPTYGPDHHLLVLAECTNRRLKATERTTERLDSSKPKNVKSFFVRTGQLSKGATFGLEQQEKDVFVISYTNVKCLRIPKRFLLQHDPYSTSIWDRIKLFQRLNYPKNEKVLEKVKQEWDWIKYKSQQTQAVISQQKILNHTSIADVPVVFRLGKVPGL